MGTNQEASITIRAYDKASFAVLGVAANLETLGKKMHKTSQMGYAFGELGKQLAPIGARMQAIGGQWAAASRRIAYTGVAIGGAAAGLVKFATSAVEAADKIGDLSSRYQIGSESLQVYGSLVKDAGGTMEDAAAGIGKFKKAMNEATHGGKEQAEAFAGIGLSVQQLKKMTPEEAMLKMADSFKGSNKDMAKQAVLLQLMGKNGTIYMDVMNQGSVAINARLEKMRLNKEILNKQQLNFADSFSKRWDRMTGTLQGVMGRIGLTIAKRLEPHLVNFEKWLSGPGGDKLEAEFGRIFSDENINAFKDAMLALWDVVKGIGKAFKFLNDTIGPNATLWLGLGIVLAPVGGALFATGKALWDVAQVMTILAVKIPGVSTGIASIGQAFTALLPGLEAFALRAATIFYPITVALAAIYSGFKALEAYQRLNDSLDRSAQDKQVRDEKRTAYDKQLMTVVGGDALVKGMKNYDFQQLDQVMKGLEQGGKVPPGTAARLSSTRIEVGGTLKIDINSAGQAKVTEVNKKGALDFDVSTGLSMAGG